MKVCPRCGKTYSDENLNFCLDDGNVLAQASAEVSAETVLMNQPRPTLAAQQQAHSPQYQPQGAAPAWNTAPQQHSPQIKKSSKTWVWVLLILGVLVLLCGGGLVGFLAYVGSQMDISNTNSNTAAPPRKQVTSASPSVAKNNSNAPANSTPSSERTDLEIVDLNEWVRTPSGFGNKEFKNGEFYMSAKQKGFYYVLAAPADTSQTENADTRVTLRNVDAGDSRLGYGIVFHSDPTPLQQGYAFLIDTKKLKYRVVHHSPQKEESVITWTKSDAIRSGSEENTLEVRDLSDKVELYINGTLVNTIRNTFGYSGGVVGLYSGDAVNVAFKNLEIRK